eukprot:TRINITY_DN8824_c0_g1_i1.p1 TRINITY_DN8824_c0_g1~~TRINITY_DN8824_c0_g1_i1.p1  ORF type:complete len:308 (+),score=65.26 TRINITY_DN8824_c0_g1_i1:73-924(+)
MQRRQVNEGGAGSRQPTADGDALQLDTSSAPPAGGVCLSTMLETSALEGATFAIPPGAVTLAHSPRPAAVVSLRDADVQSLGGSSTASTTSSSSLSGVIQSGRQFLRPHLERTKEVTSEPTSPVDTQKLSYVCPAAMGSTRSTLLRKGTMRSPGAASFRSPASGPTRPSVFSSPADRQVVVRIRPLSAVSPTRSRTLNTSTVSSPEPCSEDPPPPGYDMAAYYRGGWSGDRMWWDSPMTLGDRFRVGAVHTAQRGSQPARRPRPPAGGPFDLLRGGDRWRLQY